MLLKFQQLGFQILVAVLQVGRFQVSVHLAQHVFITFFSKVSLDDLDRVGFSLSLGLVHHASGPKTEQLVAAGFNLKHHVLVVDVLGFKGVDAIL